MADIFNFTDTWNNGATAFDAIKCNVTDTASDAASLLINMQVGSSTKFSVRKDGHIVAASEAIGGATLGTNALAVTGTSAISSTVTATRFIATDINNGFTLSNGQVFIGAANGSDNGLAFNTGGNLSWGFGGSMDLTLSRNAAGVLQIGNSSSVKNASGAWLAAKGTLTGGTLADQAQVFAITATQPASPTGTQKAITNVITSAGSASQVNTGYDFLYGAGYTGSSIAQGLRIANAVAGTVGSALFVVSGDVVPSVAGTLVVDNNDKAIPIFLARDNASTVFTIADGGNFTATGIGSITNATDSTTTTTGALQVAGGMAVRKRIFADGITASAGLQTAVICQSSAGELIADSVACLASSARFKDLLGDAEKGALDKIIRVPVQRWKYRREEGSVFPDNYYSEHIGPTAEDIEAIDSRLVGRDKEGKVRSISTDQLLALAIQAIQEQQVQIEELKARAA